MARTKPYQNKELSDFYTGLDQNDLALIDGIAGRVNTRVDQLTGAAPLWFRPSFYAGSIVVAVTAVALWWMMSPEKTMVSETAQTGQQNTIQPPQPGGNSGQPSIQSPGGITVEHENPEHETHAEKPKSGREKEHNESKEEIQTASNLEDKPKIEEIKEEKVQEKTIPIVDETRRMTEDENAFVLLRIGRVSVMSKTDLASASGTSEKNTDVTNPNIGGKTLTKTSSNDYSIDDMPYHEGGDQGLVSYITRNLNNKIHIRKRDAVYSVNVVFEVSAKGTVGNVEIMDDLPGTMGDIIRQVILNDNGWNAGKKSGKKGSLQIILNISFY